MLVACSDQFWDHLNPDTIIHPAATHLNGIITASVFSVF